MAAQRQQRGTRISMQQLNEAKVHACPSCCMLPHPVDVTQSVLAHSRMPCTKDLLVGSMSSPRSEQCHAEVERWDDCRGCSWRACWTLTGCAVSSRQQLLSQLLR